MSTYAKIMTIGLAAGLLGAVACRYTEYNPGHCANEEGDATCERSGDGSRPYCRRGTDECIVPGSENGCVAERPDDACYSPCGGRSSIDQNGECVMAEESTSSTTGESTTTTVASDSGTSSTSEPPTPCVGPEDCPDLAAPFCNDAGLCVACNLAPDPQAADAACAGLDPQTPVCRDDGLCVTCTAERFELCDAQLLVCDDAAGDCVPCSAHDQCQSGACHFVAGTCFSLDDVVHIDGDGPADFPSINAAVAFVNAGQQAVFVVHELDRGAPYTQAALINGNRTIALVAAPGERPILQGVGGGSPPSLSVTGEQAIVYIDRMQLSGNTAGLGLLVDAAHVVVDRSLVVQNTAGGIRAQNGAQAAVRNCFVGGNEEANVLELQGSAADILYTTLGAGLGVTRSIQCDASSMAVVRNSLIISRSDDPEVVCANLDAAHTASEVLLDGLENVALGTMETTWFQGFNAGDFHLAPAHPAAIDTAAQWQLGDPTTDIDGDPRPIADASPDFAGADVPL